MRGFIVLGLSVVEVLVALALLTIVLGGGTLLSMRSTQAGRTAQDLARHVSMTRWSVVSAGTPSTLVGGSLPGDIDEVVGAFACHPGGLLVRRRWAPPRGTVVRWPPMGLAFAPDGRPRRCDGSAVGNTTILIEGPRGDRAAVIVASLGRVRWERR